MCDPNCNVTVNLLDLTLEMLLKIKEYRDIRQAIEALHQAEAEQEMQNRG